MEMWCRHYIGSTLPYAALLLYLIEQGGNRTHPVEEAHLLTPVELAPVIMRDAENESELL